ncbi:hypothetical protein DPMN_018232 [Dreissena polymorpha]|uniref:Uncharacterized protein n=1 Tax=Dreissena polymorpha TaxID=45954 RepID=A0A9D4S838_DREPO|nr:hypothetical protein DPMN_018232 [Dreissena polymorpha]
MEYNPYSYDPAVISSNYNDLHHCMFLRPTSCCQRCHGVPHSPSSASSSDHDTSKSSKSSKRSSKSSKSSKHSSRSSKSSKHSSKSSKKSKKS